MNNIKSSVGILGMGFLGKILAEMGSWSKDSWGTWHSSQVALSGIKKFHFDWEDVRTWNEIPSKEVVLILTIPPPKLEIDSLNLLLRDWSSWMNHERPIIRRLIYISTTGVYPMKNETWREDSVFEPETESGRKRLCTERQLSNYFSVQVIRPGGIYGPRRNLLERLKTGKSIPDTGVPTHRIHVKDLAQIICHCIRNPEITLLNAVDFEPCPSIQVMNWLLKHHPEASGLRTDVQEKPSTQLSLIQRFISNQRLKELGIRLEYPSYKEGMI